MMARFAGRFELLDTGGKPAREVFSAEELGGIRALLSAGGSPLGAEAMDLLPELGVPSSATAPAMTVRVDLTAAAARNIAVGHSPGANAASVAGIAMTLMLATTRRILVADHYVRSGDWGGVEAVADDAAAGRDARPPHRRLRDGRDRPQDRGALRRLRERRSAGSAAQSTDLYPAHRSRRRRRRLGTVRRADDRGTGKAEARHVGWLPTS